MTTYIQPISNVNERATNALIREIGVVDTIRFLNQFRAGTGNYTAERDQLFKGMSVKNIINEIKMRRKSST